MSKADTRKGTIAYLGGTCPVQGEGLTLDGNPWYFRARYGTWTFSVARMEDGERAVMYIDCGLFGAGSAQAVDVCVGYRSGWHVEEEWPYRVSPVLDLVSDQRTGTQAGWMPMSEAEEIIDRCLERYAAGSLPWVEVSDD